MDADEALEDIRSLVNDVHDLSDDPAALADAIATRFAELDEYLTDGGDLPEDWSR